MDDSNLKFFFRDPRGWGKKLGEPQPYALKTDKTFKEPRQPTDEEFRNWHIQFTIGGISVFPANTTAELANRKTPERYDPSTPKKEKLPH